MINYHMTLVKELNSILPTYYEYQLDSSIDPPCISYMLLNEVTLAQGDTLGYDEVYYQITVWGKGLKTVLPYSEKVHAKMRSLGFRLTSCIENQDGATPLCRRIMTYRGLALDKYNLGGK